MRLVVFVSAALAWPCWSAQASIDRVAWMKGCWQQTSGDEVEDEYWNARGRRAAASFAQRWR